MKFLIDLNSSCFDRYLGFPRLGPSSAPVMNPPPPPVSCKAPSLPLMKAPLQTGVLSPPRPGHHSGGDTVGTLGLLIKVDLLERSGGPYAPFPSPQAYNPPKLWAWGAGRQPAVPSAGPGGPIPLGVPQPAVPNALVCPNRGSVRPPPVWLCLASEQRSPLKGCPGCRGHCCPQAGAGGPSPETEGPCAPSWHPPRDVLLTTRAR